MLPLLMDNWHLSYICATFYVISRKAAAAVQVSPVVFCRRLYAQRLGLKALEVPKPIVKKQPQSWADFSVEWTSGVYAMASPLRVALTVHQPYQTNGARLLHSYPCSRLCGCLAK